MTRHDRSSFGWPSSRIVLNEVSPADSHDMGPCGSRNQAAPFHSARRRVLAVLG